MSEELKPCPFCGSDEVEPVYDGRGFVFIACTACGAAAACFHKEEEGDAITAWNRRAPIDVLSDNIKFIDPSDRPVTKGEGQ